MESITEAFPLIGFCTCLYAAARLLHYVSLTLQDDPGGSILSPILLVACILLWLLSLPVTIVFHFLNKLHTDRLCRIAREEGKEIGYRLAEVTLTPPKSPLPSPRTPTRRTPFD